MPQLLEHQVTLLVAEEIKSNLAKKIEEKPHLDRMV
jgi:hypothetical protein